LKDDLAAKIRGRLEQEYVDRPRKPQMIQELRRRQDQSEKTLAKLIDLLRSGAIVDPEFFEVKKEALA